MARRFLAVVTPLLLSISSPAQINPEENIRKILDAITEEMLEIDRLLMESSRKDASAGMAGTADRLKQLLQRSQTTQDQVIDDIQKLIDEIESMQSSSSPSSSGQRSQEQQDQPGPQPRDQQRSTREQTPSPEMIERTPGEERPAREPEPNQPQRDSLSQGENVDANKRPEDATENAERPADSARWGNLPKYVRFMMNRGGLPDVPEKYRRLLEAYQKQTHKRRGK